MQKPIEDLYFALGMELRNVNDDSAILWWCLLLTPGGKKNNPFMQIHLSFWTSEIMTMCLILLSKEMI